MRDLIDAIVRIEVETELAKRDLQARGEAAIKELHRLRDEGLLEIRKMFNEIKAEWLQDDGEVRANHVPRSKLAKGKSQGSSK